MRKTLLILATLILSYSVNAKKPLNHDAFDSWQGVRNQAISRSGEWSAYLVQPQEGDGVLTFHNNNKGKDIVIPRGYSAQFSADGKWGYALIKPLFADTRKAKIDKKKDFDLPQDSLAIIDLIKGTVEKIPNVISYKIGKDGGEWVAYQSCDTTYIKPSLLKEKSAGKPLVVKLNGSPISKIVKWVESYAFSDDGKKLGISVNKSDKDSIATNGVGIINLPDTSFILLDRNHKHYGAPVFNKRGDKLSYVADNDSTKGGTRKGSLYLVDLSSLSSDIPRPQEMADSMSENQPIHLMRPHASDPELQAQLMKEWQEKTQASLGRKLHVNQYSTPIFSEDGKRLIIGMAPYVAPDDTTIVDFERATLDIWRWDAPLTPPQENKAVDQLRKHSFPLVINLSSGDKRLLTTNDLVKVSEADKWNSDWVMLTDPTEDVVSQQWDYFAPENISVMNISTGEVKNIGKLPKESNELSPSGRYVLWFEDKQYYVFDNESGERRCISEEIEYPLWDETDDHPMIPQPWGRAAWTKGDEAVLVYDRYDIWSIDPQGKRKPYSITGGNGRKENLKYRYVKTDPESLFVTPEEDMLLSVFSYADKRNGYAFTKPSSQKSPVLKTLEENSFTQLKKAKDAPVYTFQKSNFSTMPNIYLAKNGDFAKSQRLTDTNPQLKDYYWGTAQLVKWRAYNGQESEGVLYLPENFNENESYPMLAVFYETGSEELYTHYTMEPSWSWVNYPFYVSRGYVVFVPDIHYTPGLPGESAYTYVCSGVEEMCRRYPQIDRNRIGIDGQSWGGYQTAFLVTRTDMFACAGSGAPVSNMTSAYGGIRWGSGDSRMGQYEMGQSRIGKTLWESPELYIANSPVFHADRVTTPLLIMHNDADGAVPWYQGIEMFMALRRLHKPVWMLQYNGEAHNLKERRNRKDITIRLQQFFDHYLKGDPMPKWMKEGIPAIRKGQEMGTEF